MKRPMACDARADWLVITRRRHASPRCVPRLGTGAACPCWAHTSSLPLPTPPPPPEVLQVSQLRAMELTNCENLIPGQDRFAPVLALHFAPLASASPTKRTGVRLSHEGWERVRTACMHQQG